MDSDFLSGLNAKMICILTKNDDLAKALRAQFTRIKVKSRIISLDGSNPLLPLYDRHVVAAIVDENLPGLPKGVSADVLNSLGQRMPVIVVGKSDPVVSEGEQSGEQEFFVSDDVTVLNNPSPAEIVATLSATGILGVKPGRSSRRTVPFYNLQIAINLMRRNGGIAVLTVDASSFRKIEIKYGTDVYSKVKEVFQNLLNNLWGQPEAFRADDVLCRRSAHGNIFHIFLSRSRQTGLLPLPGYMELIAERLNRTIQNALWEELNAKPSERQVPVCVTSLPMVAVGYRSALFNPCLDVGEIVQSIIEASIATAQDQSKRLSIRQRELMQTLIQSDELLEPNFQAVFFLQKLEQSDVDKAKADRSIKGVTDSLFGFESLIRVRQKKLDKVFVQRSSPIAPTIDSKYLNPLVLFSIAAQSKVALELDQACLWHAARKSIDLPGKLFVNILPRNLYFFDRLTHLFEGRENIIFEVSESEAINDFELMRNVRDRLKERSMMIAADDFGKGFAGLERVINISPDIIKFDRSLIQDIHKDLVKQKYLKGLVDAARLLNTLVLAEGVESWDEAAMLQSIGIDLVQGFFLHRPQPVEEILEQIFDFSQKTPQSSVA